MSVGASFISPTQWTANAIDQRKFAHQAAVGKAQADAANNPWNRLMDFGAGVAGMYAGSHGMGQGIAAGMGGGGGGGFMSGIRSGLGRIFGGSSAAPTVTSPSHGGYFNKPR